MNYFIYMLNLIKVILKYSKILDRVILYTADKRLIASHKNLNRSFESKYLYLFETTLDT